MITEKVTSFIPDAIREAGNTIAAAIQGGSGGSSVSWNEIQTTGTKIAQITIDETTYGVYAPDPEAADIDYDNSTSGLVATDVQAAIDEVYAETSANTGNISDLNTEVGAHDTAISNLQTAVSGKANESIIAPVEASLTASRAYAIGEQFILNGTLYTATAAITAGGTIVIDGNCTASDTVTEQFKSLLHVEAVATTGNTINSGNTDISITEPTVSGYKVLALINAFVNTSSPIWVKGFYYDSGTTWRLKVQSQETSSVTRTIIYTWLMIKE